MEAKKSGVKRKLGSVKVEKDKKKESDDAEDGSFPVKKLKTVNKQEKESVFEKKPTKKAKPKTKVEESKLKLSGGSVSWKVEDVIGANLNVPVWAAKNVVQLLDEGCTIPFIARYRKEQTGEMEVQKLRDTCTMLEELRFVMVSNST